MGVWNRLKERCQADGEIDFDHFLLAVRDGRASNAPRKSPTESTAQTQAAAPSGKPSLGLPIASKHPGKAEGVPALPIAGRNHGAMTAMGLPVAKRGGGLALPIAGRNS